MKITYPYESCGEYSEEEPEKIEETEDEENSNELQRYREYDGDLDNE